MILCFSALVTALSVAGRATITRDTTDTHIVNAAPQGAQVKMSDR